ncbi:HTH domain-containing protein [Niastella caeni]|uniref:HTH domain-containing protein n=1 Tax=Niastella caeni TaxID=2569763 RepID=A0A4S8HVU3_9BACT|nr:HTH domain-containing protein [Niastella caeni]THU39311.1 HTH domain-containing protein [Niastella caeni]
MINEIIERFQHIDTLIQEHKTGTPSELAGTVGVSERTIYKYIRLMKNLGAPIAFNTLTKTYYYTLEGSFICAFSFSEKSVSDKIRLSFISMGELIEQMSKNMTLNNN